MSMNSRGLGRGLDALFQNNQATGDMETTPQDTPFQALAVEAIAPNPGQPREYFSEESLKELADSVREKGVLQPILVRPTTQPGNYQIVAGERRWRAAKMAGLTHIPAVIRELDDREALVVALIENVQREDLNPIEEARAMLSLKETLGISQEALGAKLGKQRVTVSNTLRLLRLTPEAQEDVIAGRITAGHARCILALPAGKWAEELREHMIETGMSVREAEEAVAFWRTEERFPWQKPGRPLPMGDAELTRLADELGTTLNCKAKISGTSERGRISIAYTSNIQFDALLHKLGLADGANPVGGQPGLTDKGHAH